MDEFDEPTRLTKEDIDRFLESISTEEIKFQQCLKCGEDFLRNYSYYLCDECFFAQFPKEQRMAFYQHILDQII